MSVYGIRIPIFENLKLQILKSKFYCICCREWKKENEINYHVKAFFFQNLLWQIIGL